MKVMLVNSETPDCVFSFKKPLYYVVPLAPSSKDFIHDELIRCFKFQGMISENGCINLQKTYFY